MDKVDTFTAALAMMALGIVFTLVTQACITVVSPATVARVDLPGEGRMNLVFEKAGKDCWLVSEEGAEEGARKWILRRRPWERSDDERGPSEDGAACDAGSTVVGEGSP